MSSPRAFWTRERCIEALHAWYEIHGRAPAKVADWGRSAPEHPPASSIDRQFGTWNAAIEAAGLPKNKPGMAWRLSKDEVAERLLDWLLEHGAWPTKVEWDSAGMRPSCSAIDRMFGTWNAARRYAGWRATCANCDEQLPAGRQRWCSERCRQAAFRRGGVIALTQGFVCVGCGGDEFSETIGCEACWYRNTGRARRAAARSGVGEVVEPADEGSDSVEIHTVRPVISIEKAA